MPKKSKNAKASQSKAGSGMPATPSSSSNPKLTTEQLRNQGLDGSDGTRWKTLRLLEILARHQAAMRRCLTAAHALGPELQRSLDRVRYLQGGLQDLSLELIQRDMTEGIQGKLGRPISGDSKKSGSRAVGITKEFTVLAKQIEAWAKALEVKPTSLPPLSSDRRPNPTTKDVARIYRRVNSGESDSEAADQEAVFCDEGKDLEPLLLFDRARAVLLLFTDAFNRRDAKFFRDIAYLLDRPNPTEPLDLSRLTLAELATEIPDLILSSPAIKDTLADPAVGSPMALHTIRRVNKALGRAGKQGKPKGQKNSAKAPHRPGKDK